MRQKGLQKQQDFPCYRGQIEPQGLRKSHPVDLQKLIVFKRVGRIKTGDFPVGMAMTKDGSRLYVTNMNGNDVAVVDLTNRKVIHRFPVGGQPEGITLVE